MKQVKPLFIYLQRICLRQIFLTTGLFYFISFSSYAQDVQIAGDLYVGDFSIESDLPKVKIKMTPENNSGLLIENLQGSAHTWLPYTNGSIYLTGDLTGEKEGDIIFRTWKSGENYRDKMIIDGPTGRVTVNSLSTGFVNGSLRPLYVSSLGTIVTKTESEVWSIGGIAFNCTDEDFILSSAAYVSTTDANNVANLYAPVNLPHGALIQEIIFEFLDSDPTNNLRGSLVKQSIPDVPTAGLNIIAEVATMDTPGTIELSDITITEPIIDNQNATYYIYVSPLNQWRHAGNATINSVRIKYTR